MGGRVGEGRDETWRAFGLKLTKKRKTFRVIDFKNFTISNFKANIFQSLFSHKNALFWRFFSLEISWGGWWWNMKVLWVYSNQKVKYWDLKIFNIFYFYISNLKANIFKSFFTEKCPFLTFFFLSKSHGGGVGGMGMKHKGPLGLNKPKTFSYWDFKNFNISNLKVNIFQSLFSSISMVFSKFLFQNIMRREVGSGGRVIQEPECGGGT